MELVVRCRNCKVRFSIPEMGPCSDLEYEKYLQESGVSCKCGNNDWELLDQINY